MTFPKTPPADLQCCPSCGTVRVMTPSNTIEPKIFVPNARPQIAPCPVCGVIAAFNQLVTDLNENAEELAAESTRPPSLNPAE